MKQAALVLALCVAATQSVAAADCCCIIVCKHREEKCSKCGHAPAPKPAQSDCCKKSEAARPAPGHAEDGGRCAHLEPSSEVEHQAAHAVASPPVLAAAPVAVMVAGPGIFERPLAESMGEPRGSPPLHLLYSVLRI